MSPRKPKPPEIALVFEKVTAAELAKRLGITPQSIAQWQRVPPERIIDVERITGIPREQLRPDLAEIFASCNRKRQQQQCELPLQAAQ